MREVGAGAFNYCERLRGVRLNEGLEKLGTMKVVGGREWVGEVFASTQVKDLELPSTLRKAKGGKC